MPNRSAICRSITILCREMLKSGYLLEDYDDSKRLLRKGDLLQRWVNGYQEILRPKLFIGMYESFKKDFVRNYANQPIEEWQGSWGGEPAAAIYTKHLVPEILTMYVPNEVSRLTKDVDFTLYVRSRHLCDEDFSLG